jgi:hypothetical protein
MMLKKREMLTAEEMLKAIIVIERNLSDLVFLVHIHCLTKKMKPSCCHYEARIRIFYSSHNKGKALYFIDKVYNTILCQLEYKAIFFMLAI